MRPEPYHEALDVLCDLGFGVDFVIEEPISRTLALALAAEYLHRDVARGRSAGDETVEDWLWSMVETGLLVSEETA